MKCRSFAATAAAAACAALALVTFSGCAAQRGARVAEVVAVDEDRLWETALDVVGERFHIASAQRSSGLIETHHVIGPFSMTSVRKNAPLLSGESVFRTVRRRATVRIATGGESVGVEVEKEYSVRDHPDTVPVGTYSTFTPYEYSTGGQLRWRGMGRNAAAEILAEPLEFIPGTRTGWRAAGRDRDLEEAMRREILSRYAAR